MINDQLIVKSRKAIKALQVGQLLGQKKISFFMSRFDG